MAGRPLGGRGGLAERAGLATTARAVAGRLSSCSFDKTTSMERLVLAIGAVLRRPEMVMGTYGSDGGGGQGVSGFVSNVLFRGGAECALLRGPELELQCGSTASWVLPVRLSTAMSTTALESSSRSVLEPCLSDSAAGV